MSLFARLVRLVRANLHDVLERLRRRARPSAPVPVPAASPPAGPPPARPAAQDDPLQQAILAMNARLIAGKKEVAIAIADEKHLAKQIERESSEAAEWERRAVLAIEQGDEALANEALRHKKDHAARAADYEREWRAHKVKADQVKTSLRALNDEIEEAKRRQFRLRARARAVALRAATPLEAYFVALGRRYRQVGEGAFVLDPPAARGRPVEVRVAADGAVSFSAALGVVPAGEAGLKLALRLLETNGAALVHCAYGARDGVFVVFATRALSDLGPSELEAILSDLDLAIARHERDMAPAPSARSNLERRALLSWEFLPASRSSSRRTSMT